MNTLGFYEQHLTLVTYLFGQKWLFAMDSFLVIYVSVHDPEAREQDCGPATSVSTYSYIIMDNGHCHEKIDDVSDITLFVICYVAIEEIKQFYEQVFQ